MGYTISELFRISEFETILNEFSGKRYHLRQSCDMKISLIEVEKIGKERVIVKDLTLEQMYSYFKKHLKVSLVPFDGWKAVEHSREFWDQLDPRDRDVLLNKANFKANTLADWRALSREEQENIVKWFYY